MSAAPDKVVTYIRMDEGTVEDYAYLHEVNKPFHAQTPQRVLAQLKLLQGSFGGQHVTRYEHSLQTASRAQRAGECEEFVVAALLHDVGDLLAPDNHADIAADILRPYVSRYTFWMVKHHGIFQGYYFWDKIGKNKNERERFRDHPAFEMTERFCGEYDQQAFDPSYDTIPLEDFEPMVNRIFARTPWGEHTRSDWAVN
ncbi:MAG: phosphohydrolase [Thiotrichales bacterium]|nr:phosphohydrolase [Thiotrichales bacterium]|tara:strand:- start:372 stop:968 length:597 start_codon:yes stop_codon:yes gene_type:complete